MCVYLRDVIDENHSRNELEKALFSCFQLGVPVAFSNQTMTVASLACAFT